MTTGLQSASLPVVRSMIETVRKKGYNASVLGVRARPEWSGDSLFALDGAAVRVVPCPSALAAREALLTRADDEWLVILTDRDEQDLGAGIVSRLVGQRLRSPDPWEGVKLRFSSSGLDPSLTAHPHARELALGLLQSAPAAGWPAAPGGVLTVDHALGSVAWEHLGLQGDALDVPGVLLWSVQELVTVRTASLRSLAGDLLTDVVLDWIARLTGVLSEVAAHLLRGGAASDFAPLGLVAGLLVEAWRDGGPEADQAREALVRLEPSFGGAVPAPGVLSAWGQESGRLVKMLLPTDGADESVPVRSRAEQILASSQGSPLAVGSQYLAAGLTARLHRLAAAMLKASEISPTGGLDAPIVHRDALADVEAAFSSASQHALWTDDPRRIPFLAAVRMVRWLAADVAVSALGLAPLVARQASTDCWIDAAVNDAAVGVSDPALGAALAAVLEAVRRRRDAHDLTFATALRDHIAADPPLSGGTHLGVLHVEDLLPSLVLPLARTSPTLLLVLDGMSCGVATELIDSALRNSASGWAEATLPGHSARAAAIAVLPSITEITRASLLSGELRRGQQDLERHAFDELCSAYGLKGAALLHKKPLDSSGLGHALADDVRLVLEDTTGHPLVACVLNTIDDALDRSDPGGTEWHTEAVRHLAALLETARRADRTVVLTADHGHVIERRQGIQRSFPGSGGNRFRETDAPTEIGEDEVLVEGRRVLAGEGRVVLAVDERLRYGPLKAGYHGGGAPAEVVVPVAVLVPGRVPDGSGLTLAGPQDPAWWAGPVSVAPIAVEVVAPSRKRQPVPNGQTTMFDDREPAIGGAAELLAERVTASPAYAAQRQGARRLVVTDHQVRGLLAAAVRAGGRLPTESAATALDTPVNLLRGAIVQIQSLLNLDGYGVVTWDADGVTLVLDQGLLREQFELLP